MIDILKNYWLKILIKFAIELSVVLLIGSAILYFFSANFAVFLEHWLTNLAYSGLLGYSLWKGNEFGYINIHRNKRWEKKIRLKFVAGVLYVLIYSVITLLLVELFWNLVSLDRSIAEYQFPSLRYLLIILGVCFTISFIVSIIHFIGDKKENLIKEEQLKARILKLEYETLKNQLSPHFLFNSLNALTSLVGDNDDAVKFIKNLSDFYRYVLEQKDKEIVSLKTELDLLNVFHYILKMRFGNGFNLNIQIDDSNKSIIPLSLQILVENAVKLNLPSEENPLYIKIYQSGNYLKIEYDKSNFFKTETDVETAVERIKKRYNNLTDSVFEEIEDDKKYIVNLPLLEIKDESSSS